MVEITTERGDLVLNSKQSTLCTWGLASLGVLSLLAPGCTRTADEAACDKLYTHIIALKTAGEPEIVRKVGADKLESERFDFLKSCVGKYNRKLTTCSLGADTLRKLELCMNE